MARHVETDANASVRNVWDKVILRYDLEAWLQNSLTILQIASRASLWSIYSKYTRFM